MLAFLYCLNFKISLIEEFLVVNAIVSGLVILYRLGLKH